MQAPVDERRALDSFFSARVAGLHSLPADAPLPRGFMEPAGSWTVPATVSVDRVQARYGHSTVPVVTYTPKIPAAGGPVIVWMHGGGFVEGSVDHGEAHAVCAELAARAGIRAVSVDYRLVTDSLKYPAPLEDVLAAWQWTHSQYPDSRVMIGGTSAGANLAASASTWLRDDDRPLPAAMVLVYGVFHAQLPAPAGPARDVIEALPRRLRHLPEDVARLNENYAGHPAPWPSHMVPGDHDVEGLPQALVITAEIDDLAGSSRRFATGLSDAGVPVRTYEAMGMLHGYLNWFPGAALPEVDRTIDAIANYILHDTGETEPFRLASPVRIRDTHAKEH